MTKEEYANSIEEGIKLVNKMDYENGMATYPVTVELENSYLKIIRKCGSLDHPEILLFKVIPENNSFIIYPDIAKDIVNALDIYGDIRLVFKGEGPIKTAIIENISN